MQNNNQSALTTFGIKVCPKCDEKYVDTFIVVYDVCEKCGAKLIPYVFEENKDEKSHA